MRCQLKYDRLWIDGHKRVSMQCRLLRNERYVFAVRSGVCLFWKYGYADAMWRKFYDAIDGINGC